MVEKKRRQGRGKTLKTICPTCQQEYLQACMGWQTEDGNRKLKRIGQYCPNPACDYMIKDFVELPDNDEENMDKVKDFAEACCDQNSLKELKEALTEKDTEPEDKLKKLQAEFFKTHEQLNILAEQINELETE